MFLIRMARNKRNFAGIAQMASFPVISDHDDASGDDSQTERKYSLYISKSTGAQGSNTTGEKSLRISKSTGAMKNYDKVDDDKSNNLSISRSQGKQTETASKDNASKS
jgi:hypothetical protein